MKGWDILPDGVVVHPNTFNLFAQHLALTMPRDSIIDKYWGPDLRHLLDVIPDIPQLQRERYACRMDFPRDLSASAPHWDRSFIVCPLNREDRESPLIAHQVWEMVDATGLCHDSKVCVSLFMLFARRVIHQWPPGWSRLLPFLRDTALMTDFDPASKSFRSGFSRLVAREGITNFYGRGSHWFSAETFTEDSEDTEPKRWCEDSVDLMIVFWRLVPFLHAVAGVSTGVADVRADLITRLILGEPGLSHYAAKFILGDMRELYHHVMASSGAAHMLTMVSFTAVGPALRKFVALTGLFRQGVQSRGLGAGLVDRHALSLVRFLYRSVVDLMQSGVEGSLGYYMMQLLMRRAEAFPQRSALFDLQDVQCRICGTYMVMGEGAWFRSWGKIQVMGDIPVLACFGVIAASLACGSAKKRTVESTREAQGTAHAPSKKARGNEAPSKKMLALKDVAAALPAIDAGARQGIMARRVAAMFGFCCRTEVCRAMAHIKAADVANLRGNKGWVLLSQEAVARFCIALPDSGEILKVKSRCAAIVARVALAPRRRADNALALVHFLYDLAKESNAVLHL